MLGEIDWILLVHALYLFLTGWIGIASPAASPTSSNPELPDLVV